MLSVAHFDTMFINQPSHDHIYAKNFHDMDTSKYKLLKQILNVETKKKERNCHTITTVGILPYLKTGIMVKVQQ